jgi:2-polyprenyl-3-methyl-5-hydroxy-6-metoxy-1,4-benzoquinol methylase
MAGNNLDQLTPAKEMEAEGPGNPQEACPFCGAGEFKVVHRLESGGARLALARCRGCGLHFTDPRPSRAFLSRLYSGDYHAELRVEGGSERTFGPKYHRYADWIDHFVGQGRALDIGCSTGLLVSLLARRGYRAEGVEINPATAEWGRRHYGVPIYAEPFEECGFAKGSFDVVTLTDVLEHTLHPLYFLQTVARVLAPRGFVLVTFPDIKSLESRYYYLLSKALRRSWLWATCHAPAHVWEFTPRTSRAVFERAGFAVVGFRRSQPPYPSDQGWKLWLLGLPTLPLAWPALGRRFGTQMEFMLRKAQ